jgi:hypothetical protein
VSLKRLPRGETKVVDYDLPPLPRIINDRGSMRSISDAIEALSVAEVLSDDSIIQVRTFPIQLLNAIRYGDIDESDGLRPLRLAIGLIGKYDPKGDGLHRQDRQVRLGADAVDYVEMNQCAREPSCIASSVVTATNASAQVARDPSARRYLIPPAPCARPIRQIAARPDSLKNVRKCKEARISKTDALMSPRSSLLPS